MISLDEFKIPSAEYLPNGFNEFVKLIETAEKEGKKLRVKLGIDPTSTDLHLGHTVCLHILRKFQERGHIPVLLIGGFTATVGDPTGRNEARPPLTYEQVQANAKTYLDQVTKILDINKTEVVNNYDWLGKLTSQDFVRLCHLVTVNQLIAKEAFGSRVESGKPLYLHEVLYPILQGYDSVQIKADIELGGTDQKFNILFGRYLQKSFNQKEQFAMLFPLLIGLDGTRKMSKSFGNYIALNDSPKDVFGKAMSIPDELMFDYFKLVTKVPYSEISNYESEIKAGKNPRDIKLLLGYTLVKELYGEEIAKKEKENFINQFSKNELPSDMPEFKLLENVKIIDLLLQSNMTPSKSEAKRLIQSGAVKFNSEKISDPNIIITTENKNLVIQVGKRNYLRIV